MIFSKHCLDVICRLSLGFKCDIFLNHKVFIKYIILSNIAFVNKCECYVSLMKFSYSNIIAIFVLIYFLTIIR